MDNVTLEQLAQRCNLLTEKIFGVWSADNFPAMKRRIISNSEHGTELYAWATLDPTLHTKRLCSTWKSGHCNVGQFREKTKNLQKTLLEATLFV